VHKLSTSKEKDKAPIKYRVTLDSRTAIMAFLRSVVAASVVAGAVAFAPASVLPSIVSRSGGTTPLTVVMNGGTGRYKDVGIRGAARGQAGKPPVKTDPLAIDLELVQGIKRVDVVDISYKKPPSSFFSTGAVVPPTPKPTAAAPKPYARAYGAKEWDEARRQGSFGSDGEPVSLAPSDIAVGAKIGANRRRQGSIVAALENLFKRK
jgi:hypothetical protein